MAVPAGGQGAGEQQVAAGGLAVGGRGAGEAVVPSAAAETLV